MNHQPLATSGKIAALAFACWLFSPGKATAVTDDGYEILTRGPVHEAFAGTVTFDPEPGIIIDTAPPATIEELPPEQQLEGENVVWIPGYWAWDEEQNSFLWVSGIWRNLPPGREWVPGYWNPVMDDRYQWISGYWADTEQSQVSYLPAPPRSIESGPSIAADSTDQLWLPGSWVYQRNDYAWRSGYWSAPRENWVYVPATYIWTPRGHIFVDGYWDYAIPRRGVVFAPVRFHRPVYAAAGYSYSPWLVISLSLFTDHLFLRPSYRHYYFGDYYASGYGNRGYYSCFNYHNSRRGYDPVYAYNRWSHRDDRNWERDYRSRYEILRDRESARPPRTWAAMKSRPEYLESSRALATPIGQYAGNREATDGQKFRNVDRPARERIAAETREVRSFRNERQKTEGRAERTAQASTGAMNVERSRSPIASRVRSDARTPGRTAPPAVGPSAREPERPARMAERSGMPSARPVPSQREARPVRVSPPRREAETPRVVPQTSRTEPSRPAERLTRIQPPQRTAPVPQSVQPSQRTQPTPQRVQPPQRPQPMPQRVQPPQRLQPSPQRVQPSQRPQPTPQRVQPSQRPQPTPQRVQPTQRPQPTPQRIQPTQRLQPTPQRVQPTQRPQPSSQSVEPQRGESRGGDERGIMRGR